ncbi:hypothetical protein TrRE_jg590 [Triparma retinervis]|uniref:Pseudouridine synthase RsuA/RluA-like domain-containing protein n=1 Tax=Triparma retinervis TaxID=2557542 RepID=A0A9W7A9C1_9STRA|nr:hypothetical protein TrRE_jg590 [Triparma retinervis]
MAQRDLVPQSIPSIHSPTSSRPRIPILQYNSDHVIINKPAGISVHHGGQSFGRRLVVNTMLKRQLSRKCFPVHRLDHRTSGALVFAFSSSAAARLQVRLGESEKTYLAFVRGSWNHGDSPLIVNRPVNVGSGVTKDAVTSFTLLASQPPTSLSMGASIVLCRPKTGRTHQIRKHLKYLAHPIVGDSKHGDSKVNRWWREERGFDRLGLHALELDMGDGKVVVAPLVTKEWEGLFEEDVWKEGAGRDERLTRPFVDERGGSFGRRYREKMIDDMAEC